MPLPKRARHFVNSATDPGVLWSTGNMCLLVSTPWAMVPQAVRLLLCFAARYVSEEKRVFKSAILNTVLNDNKNSFVITSLFNLSSAAIAAAAIKPSDSSTWIAPLFFTLATVGDLTVGVGERVYNAFNKQAKPLPYLIKDPTPLWVPSIAIATSAAPMVAWPIIAASLAFSLYGRKNPTPIAPLWRSPPLWLGIACAAAGVFSAVSGAAGAAFTAAYVLYGAGYSSYEAMRHFGGVVEGARALRGGAAKPAV